MGDMKKCMCLNWGLGLVITNKIIAKLGYTSMLDYYLTVCEN